ncbi:MAG TPA: hypothetical protein VKZ18_21465 [Polyangia bacterium]|nr:hypothetical protein [Polyangia bacterium]
MIEDGRSPADVLARAQRAASPDASDVARVRRAIGAALANGGSLAVERAAGAPRPASLQGWTSKLLLAGAIAAASGGAGYWVGHRAGAREARSVPPALATAARTAEMQHPVLEPPPVVPAPPPAVPSLAPAHRDAHRAVARPAPRPTDSLELEVLGLRNAERALRDGNPGLALAFLDELDRQVPRGQLTEERDAAATLARCTRGDHPFGLNLGQDFIGRHPGSVYRSRVEQACGATDPAGAGDSLPRRSGP